MGYARSLNQLCFLYNLSYYSYCYHTQHFNCNKLRFYCHARPRIRARRQSTQPPFNQTIAPSSRIVNTPTPPLCINTREQKMPPPMDRAKCQE